jgi:hypothetical protein
MIKNMGREGLGAEANPKKKPYEVVTLDQSQSQPPSSDPNHQYLQLPVVSATDLPDVGEEIAVRTISLDQQSWQPTISDFARAKVRRASANSIELEFNGESEPETFEWADIADARSLGASRAEKAAAAAIAPGSGVLTEFHMALRRRKEELSRQA